MKKVREYYNYFGILNSQGIYHMKYIRYVYFYLYCIRMALGIDTMFIYSSI
jgi:hypothetical protein